MSRSSLLLRVLLALLLVLNGIGGAAASARMAVQHGIAGMAIAIEAAQSDRRAPCHEGMSTPHSATAEDLASSGAHSPDADCCADGSCLCACVLHCPAVPMVATFALSPAPGDVIPRGAVDGSPDPIRTHLIRPPIR